MTCARSELFLDLAAELLGRGHRVRFRAEGESMHPTIRGGEAIMVEPVPAGGLKNGDIALYRAQRGVTAHRLVRIEGQRFIMRGDAPGSADEPVVQQQVLGKVVALERTGHRIDLRRRRVKMKN